MLDRIKRCACGCGRPVIAVKENAKWILGHQQRGERNPRYKDGKSVLLLEWRRKVIARDGKCMNALCIKPHSILEAHHIKSKRKFPELMLDVKNGITYCRTCHRRIEGTGVVFDEIRKRNISLGHVDQSGEKNPFFGRRHSKESIEKMKKAHKLTLLRQNKRRKLCLVGQW